MQFVLDASACGSFLFPADEASPLGDALLSELQSGASAYVPWIWWFEVRNMPLSAVKRKRMGVADIPKMLLDIERLQQRVHTDASPDSSEVVRLGLRHNLTAYDAAYLELAVRLGIGLATLDEALRNAAIAESVALL